MFSRGRCTPKNTHFIEYFAIIEKILLLPIKIHLRFNFCIDRSSKIAIIESVGIFFTWGYSSVVEHLHGMQVAGVRFSLSPQIFLRRMNRERGRENGSFPAVEV